MDFVNDDGENTCPLCLEEMDLTDRQLKPCKCGYEICVWCWHHVMEVAEKDNTEGRCPACRTPYDKERIVGMTFNCERLMDASSEKRQKAQKSKSKTSEMRKHLSNVRVLQRNLVYIIGIPSHLADEETLERREFFGQYGKVLKVSISRSNANNQHSISNPTSSVYITYTKEEEAVRCIQAVHGYVLDGRPLRACFGTTKYCHAWLKNMPCNNPDCLYLHDIGTQEDSFTKEEMVSSSSCASKIPQFHSPSNASQRRAGSFLPPPEPELSSMNLPSSSKLPVKTASNVGCQARAAIANGTVGKSTALPAAASWGLRTVQGKTLPPKTPAISVSAKPKSSSSPTSSVSPPSYLPASAAAAAGMPMSHSDHSKPLMGSNGSQPNHCFPVNLSSNLNLKNNQMGTNVINSAGSDFSAIVTAYDKYSIQDGEDKNHSESNSQGKHAYQEEHEMICVNTVPNSDLSGKSHVDQYEATEKLDILSVSPCVVNRVNCQDGCQPFPCNHRDGNSSTLNGNSTDLHANPLGKPHLGKSIFPADVTQRDNMSCPESNKVEAIKGVSITELKDLQRSKEDEEEISGSFVQVFSETELNTKPGSSIDANKGPLDSSVWMSMAESESYSPLGPAMLKDDRRICSQLQASNTDICDSNDSRNELAYERSGGLSCSTTYTTSCLKNLFQESCNVKEDTFSRIGVSSQQIYEGHFKLSKSQSLESNQNDKFISRDNSDTDAGENSIISDILSMNFDIWEGNSITSPHNFAKALLGDKEKTTILSKDTTSSSRKFQSAGQSRFSFAREEEASIESSCFSNTPMPNGHLHNILSKRKESLDDINGYDQMNRLLNDSAASDREEYQMLTSRNASPPNMGAAAPPSVSRSQFSAPPGFSVPIRIPTVPPPGFLPQARVDRPYESITTSVFPNGIKDHDDSLSVKNSVPKSYSLLHETLGSNSSNDIELVDPAIMAVGRGKLPIGQIQHGSAGPDSVFSGPRQDVANSNFSQSLLGLRSPYSQQATPMDYDARLQMLKQKSYYMNSSLMSPRQQLKFQDQGGDAFASYLSSQNDNIIQSMMMEQSQINLDPGFSQISFQQPMNSTFRSSSVGANGWDSWNRMGSGLESGLAERRLESSLIEIANKERMGLLDPKNGLNKFFPSYGEPMFHMPSSENYYSRPFEM